MSQDSSGHSAHRLALPNGYMLDGYRIEGLLGKGGFGMTYLARDVDLDMAVAIKEMLPDGIATRVGGSRVVAQTPSQEEGLQWARQRFLEEARTLARLQHPNIIRVQRLLEANGTAYMVMEYVDGQSLDDWFRQRGTVTEPELMHVVLPLMDGLEYLHQQGLLHRDIKPENIFIARNNRVLLLDFGSARSDLGRTVAMTSVVSEGYSPLEQYQTKSSQGPYTDIYALAGVMTRAITGKRPPSPVDRISNPAVFPPLTSLHLPGWNPALLHALDAALTVMPKDRVQTIAAFREMILSGSRGGRPPGTKGATSPPWGVQGTGTTPPPIRKGSSSSTLKIALAVTACVALAAVGLLILRPGNNTNQGTVAGGGTTSSGSGGSTSSTESEKARAAAQEKIKTEVAQARQALEAGDLVRAQQEFTRLRDGASTLQGHLGLAEVHFERALYDEAQKNYEFVLQLEPKNPDAMLGKAIVLFEKLEFVDDSDQDTVRPQIAGLISNLRSLGSSASPRILELTDVLEAAFINRRVGVTAEENARAETIIRKAEQRGFSHPMALFYLGDLQDGQPEKKPYAEGTWQQASTQFATRLKTTSTRIRDWVYLVNLLSRRSAEREILELEGRFQHGGTTTPMAAAYIFSKFSLAYTNRGSSERDFESGLKAAEDGLVLLPGSNRCFNAQVLALEKLKRNEDGLTACDRYMTHNTSYDAKYRALSKKAAFALAGGDRAGAIRFFDSALDLDRTKVEAWKGRAVFRGYQLKDYAGAAEDFTEAINRLPASLGDRDRAYYYSERGSCLYLTNKPGEALADLQKALSLDPKDAAAYLFRAYLYQDGNDHFKAVDYFTKAIELNPRMLAAYRFRAKSLRAMNLTTRAEADEAKVKELGG